MWALEGDRISAAEYAFEGLGFVVGDGAAQVSGSEQSAKSGRVRERQVLGEDLESEAEGLWAALVVL